MVFQYLKGESLNKEDSPFILGDNLVNRLY